MQSTRRVTLLVTLLLLLLLLLVLLLLAAPTRPAGDRPTYPSGGSACGLAPYPDLAHQKAGHSLGVERVVAVYTRPWQGRAGQGEAYWVVPHRQGRAAQAGRAAQGK